jgi:hypothetical protein
MSRARVRDRIGPWAVLVGTAVLLSIASLPTISRAALGVATRPDCASARSVAAAAAAPSRSLATSSVDVSARLTSGGHFAGRSLRVTTAGGATSTVSLPPESFVAPRRGDALVYTLSSRGSSEVHVLDTATGCDQVVA